MSGYAWSGLGSASNAIVSPPVRQVVLFGAANFLVANGLTLDIQASASEPLILTAASILEDRTATLESAVTNAFGALIDEATSFLYADIDADMAVSWGVVGNPPTYSQTAPSTPAVGDCWFDLAWYRMQRWSGSVWEPVWRVFLGEVLTSGGSITSLVQYAIRGRYDAVITTGLAFLTQRLVPANIGHQWWDGKIWAGKNTKINRAEVIPGYHGATLVRSASRTDVIIVPQDFPYTRNGAEPPIDVADAYDDLFDSAVYEISVWRTF